uniref:Uncharacterized protein n=1 Tax=Panagrolaimus sp. PS1159 TaxID=55785 RepID=A0AC35FPD6_9BILA
MSLSPPPSYETLQAPPLPSNPTLQNLSYENQNTPPNRGTTTANGERKGGPPSPPSVPNPMILPPSVPPGGVEGPPMLPPYPYPPPAPPYYNYNVGYYTSMNGVNGGGPLGGMPGVEPPFCQGLRAGNGQTTPQGGRYYVNASGYIEHLTPEQYHNRRIVQAIATVCAVILMVVIFFIAFKNMHYR